MTNNYNMVPETTMHTNDCYYVMINTEADGYGVINRQTGVCEFESISLPECIFAAENLNVVLVYKTYEWIGKRAAEQDLIDRDKAAESKGNVVPLSRLDS